jgi:uncharacterized protein (DUF1330 family)
MSAYIVFAVTITDPAKYGEYVKHTPRIIAQFGGRMIVRGGDPTVLEGQSFGPRVVVIEFPDRKAAETFYHSAEYAKIKGIRLNAGDASGIIVDGYPEAMWTEALAASRAHVTS